MARKQQEEESGGSWMDTYGDMVTLLLTFFVMLYSMSTIVDEKWTALVSAFKIDGDEKVDVVVFEESDLNGEAVTEFLSEKLKMKTHRMVQFTILQLTNYMKKS